MGRGNRSGTNRTGGLVESKPRSSVALDIPKVYEAGISEWDRGLCDTYALALIKVHPDLKFGVAGNTDDDGWIPSHFFAHDDEYVYDITGPRKFSEIDKIWNTVERNQRPSDWIDKFGDNGSEEKFEEAINLIQNS